MDIVPYAYQYRTGIHSGKGRTFCLQCTIVARPCSDRPADQRVGGAQ